MYIHFLFADGSNPYIAITHEKLFDMIRKYDLEQLDVDTFLVHGAIHFWTVKKRRSAFCRITAGILRFWHMTISAGTSWAGLGALENSATPLWKK
jgi:hypothetical protein